MCDVFKVRRSGYYAWLKQPISAREQEDSRLLALIKEHYLASGGTYGSPRIYRDLRDAGETCSVHRVAKIMRRHRIRAQIGYKRRYIKGGSSGKVAANLLNREFNPDAPNKSWVSDITYVRTYEGFLYVATVLDLFSRRIIGWSMGKNIDRHLVIDALLMAKLGCQPHLPVLLHSDQGSQYGSNDCVAFMTANGLIPSMSRRGNCHDNLWQKAFLPHSKNVLPAERYTPLGRKPKQEYLILSRCFTIQSNVIHITTDYPRQI